jgi:hypothetical protein
MVNADLLLERAQPLESPPGDRLLTELAQLDAIL